MELRIKKVESARGLAPENIPALLDEVGVEFHEIACDNWNWSKCNPNVKFRIAHFSDGLVLHFKVSEGEVRAVETADNGRVWEDSCCEFFVSPDGDDFYYNFECNCIGTLLLHGGKKGDRPDAPTGIYSLVRRWSSLGSQPLDIPSSTLVSASLETQPIDWELVEVIPAAALFRHEIGSFDGKVMKANFYKCGDNLPHPHFLSWSPIDLPEPAFHCPQFFGNIIFE